MSRTSWAKSTSTSSSRSMRSTISFMVMTSVWWMARTCMHPPRDEVQYMIDTLSQGKNSCIKENSGAFLARMEYPPLILSDECLIRRTRGGGQGTDMTSEWQRRGYSNFSVLRAETTHESSTYQVIGTYTDQSTFKPLSWLNLMVTSYWWESTVTPRIHFTLWHVLRDVYRY